ncbi:flowering time control protein FCA-like [Impatiens glandulifera]|uniref:flowering time control protein FCA-like n=1 Tax=Impatiens glandulifera TaxID=253017 RepID=UPI001FB177B4|nr:flowering time control protein FCA-like [Impatiens glandulifera]
MVMDTEQHRKDYPEPHRSHSISSSSRSSEYPSSQQGSNSDSRISGLSRAIGDDFGPARSVPSFGRKRQFVRSDNIMTANFVKLYIANLPRTAKEEDIRAVFEKHGDIVEVVLVKDKRTGQQQEYCFLKYAKVEQADGAVAAFVNQYTFPGAMYPLEVRYADGEKERHVSLKEQEYKLYVGCINKQASIKELEEIFAAYGIVEDVFIVRDEMKQSRGCCFIKFSHKDMAVAAINGLNGTYFMKGCDQPFIVRFADPKKPRVGEQRDYNKFGASGYPQHFQEKCDRAAPCKNDPLVSHTLDGASNRPNLQMTQHSCLGLTSIKDTLDSDWSEHTCPDGYKYYYNCVTCESRWEKSEDYSDYEKPIQQHHFYQEVTSLPPHISYQQQ